MDDYGYISISYGFYLSFILIIITFILVLKFGDESIIKDFHWIVFIFGLPLMMLFSYLIFLTSDFEFINKYASPAQRHNLHRCINDFRDNHPDYKKIENKDITNIVLFCEVKKQENQKEEKTRKQIEQLGQWIDFNKGVWYEE